MSGAQRSRDDESLPFLGPDETADAALGGSVRLIQPKKGYRFSLDAVLLARFASERRANRAVDLGSGCGVVALCLLALGGAAETLGVEIQPEMVDRAVRAAAWNRWQGRATFLRGDLREARRLLPEGSFPLAVCNPPYRSLRSGRVSPEGSAALGRHEVAGTLSDFLSAATWLLGPRGDLCLVYPAARLAALLCACRSARLEPKVLRLAYPREGEAASLALLRCRKGGREGMEVRPALFLHASGARYSPEAELLLGPPGSRGRP